MRKVKFTYAMLIAVLAIALAGCKKEQPDLSVKGITLNKTALTLKVETEETLTFTIFPENATNKNVTWASSDEKVATVNNGVVKAVKPGNATITVTTKENNETAQCEVSVTAGDPVTVKGAVEGVWKKYSVINVDGHINVPKGKSLTIEEGVEINISDADQDKNATKIEFIVDGNLYVKGTEEAPVLFSVAPTKRTKDNAFNRLWGGIIGSQTCGEILLDNAIVEYTGAITTLSSPSVVNGLFKPAGGEGMVAFNTNNPKGKYVIVNSIFRYTGEDAIYVQGGDCIFANNLFYSNGDTGGEAINVKAGCTVDAAYNVMYAPNTNGFKLSSSGQDTGERYQALIKVYNNTIINAGWGRDPQKPKGGSVWIENGALAEVYNNLIVNCMFAVRTSSKDAPDAKSIVDYNFYASGTQKSSIPEHVANGTVTAYDGFKDGVKDIVIGKNDKRGEVPGKNDPKFVNFPFDTNPLLARTEFSTDWDFHLQAGSPALKGAKTDVKPYFADKGITIGGKTYKSPAAAAHYGAFGTK